MLGLIVPVPEDISSTGYIRIVADQRHCNPQRLNPHWNWELKAVEHDLDKKKDRGEWFVVTEAEVKNWLEKNCGTVQRGY